MYDEVIRELWQVKDSIARENGYDIETLVAHLRKMKRRNLNPESDHKVSKRSNPGATDEADEVRD